MNDNQLTNIPTSLLLARSTDRLEKWLHDRGLRMSLLELDRERRRRREEGGEQ